MTDLPIACNLTTAELQERRHTVLEKIRRAVVEVKELDDGYAYSFPSERESLRELADLIEVEHQCCPFLTIRLTLEAGNGPIWLELTGPPGTKEFLISILD